jgi:hypothetical protein
MHKRFWEWAQNLAGAVLRAGETVTSAFQTVWEDIRSLTGVTPDADTLRGALESEQFKQIAESGPLQSSIVDWLQDRSRERIAAVDLPVSRDIIRETFGPMLHPYQVRLHFGKMDKDGYLLKDKWVTHWYDHRPSPGEIADKADSYWATAGEIYGPDMHAMEYEVWQDSTHSDWS